VSGAADLGFVNDEVAAVCEVMPRAIVYQDESATVETVMRELESASIVHFSCHGRLDLAEPSSSGLVFYDGVASLGEVPRRKSGRRFAFISACDTASGALEHADEVVSLVGALQYSGWNSVIGSFAPVRDDIAAMVAQRFYRVWISDLQRSEASVLREAVLSVKERMPDRPDIWAPFVHFGA